MWIALEIKWFILIRIPYQFYWSTVYKPFFTEVLCRHLSNKLRQILQWRMVCLCTDGDKQVDGKNKAVEETNSF